MDFNSGTHMFPVNAAKISSAGEHHQNGLRLGIGRVVLEVENHVQFDSIKLLRPVALFASVAGGDQAVAFHGRLDWVFDAVENYVPELPGTGYLAFDPALRAWGNVAIHAFHARVRRVLMGGEFRFHDVTALSAKLGRLHMLYSAVCALGANDDVHYAGHGEENRQPASEGPPVGAHQQCLLGTFDAPPGKEDSERDQYQAEDEDNWDDNKDHNADVWVAGVASKLDGQNEQPGEPSGGHQRDTQHADPVTEEEYEYGAFWIVAHSFFTLPARNSE